MEQPHRVRAAADAGDERIRQPALGGEHLLARLVADDRLEIAHHHRIRMRAGDGADAIERRVDIGHPVAQRLVHRVLERLRSGLHRHDLGAEHVHAKHIRLLPLDIDRAHIDDAFEAEARAERRGGDAVHAGAGLGDDALLAHAPRQQNLAEHVVDLVRAGVIELLALEIDLGAATMRGQPLGEIERRRAADVMREIAVHFFLERGIGLGLGVGLLQFQDQRHQRLGDKTAAIDAEMPVLVRPGAERIGLLHGHAVTRDRFCRATRRRLPRGAHEGADLFRDPSRPARARRRRKRRRRGRA